MEADAVGNERDAYEQQEGERQHLHRRVAVDEIGNRTRRDIHHAHRHDDGGDHDLDILGHADRSND